MIQIGNITRVVNDNMKKPAFLFDGGNVLDVSLLVCLGFKVKRIE